MFINIDSSDLMQLHTNTTRIQMRFSDLDVLGHVSNNIYGQYLELGRVEWFREIPGNRVAAVVASINIDYLGEIKMGDDVYVKTWCEKVGNKSIQLVQEVFANERCVTRARVVQVGFDPKSKQSVPLLAGWEPSAVDQEPSAADQEPSAADQKPSALNQQSSAKRP